VAYSLLPGCFRAQIAISEFVASTCGSSVEVIPNGVIDVPAAGLRRERVVLVAQRFEAEKRTDIALTAWARSSLAQDGWRLEIAGRGREGPMLEARAVELGIASSVRFLGFVDDLRARMAVASIFLAPTPSDGFGLSVVEAMASGLPVVAARGGGHREVLSGFESQLFVPGDVEGCAAALERLADSDGCWQEAASRGRHRYEARYTIERHVDHLVELYERVSG
jgi:glycosyltransferase involved in cell wall biosynthesis